LTVPLQIRVIAIGRARRGRLEAPILAEGPPRAGRIAWQLQPDGSQHAALQLDGGLTGFRLAGPWYAEPAIGLIGPTDLGEPPGVLCCGPKTVAARRPRCAKRLLRASVLSLTCPP
jgi:hypothetical protein